MSKIILVVNAGSSGIKCKGYEDDVVVFSGTITCAKASGIEHVTSLKFNTSHQTEKKWEQGDGITRNRALTILLDILDQQGLAPVAIGHRVVHGGTRFSEPTLVTPEVIDAIVDLCNIAPIHNPVALEPIRIISSRYPKQSQVAVFDTALHRTAPFVNQQYALPPLPFLDEIRRYGFHGSSYEYIAKRLLEYIARPLCNDMVITAHIGSGASMCLLRWNGATWESVYCTLGFGTSGCGPMHATRAVLDADASLEIVRRVAAAEKITDVDTAVARAQAIILKQSGLLGLSGGHSDDLREIIAAADDPNHPYNAVCMQAWEMYIERSVETFGMLAGKAHAHGRRLRAVVWTAGVGEHNARYRKETARAIPNLDINDVLNEAEHPDIISKETSLVDGIVIPTDEELMIAFHTRALLQQMHQSIAAE